MYFASHIDGHKIFMGPEESMQHPVEPRLGYLRWRLTSASKIPRPMTMSTRSVRPHGYRWLVALQGGKRPPECAAGHGQSRQQMLWGINQGGDVHADLRI